MALPVATSPSSRSCFTNSGLTNASLSGTRPCILFTLESAVAVAILPLLWRRIVDGMQPSAPNKDAGCKGQRIKASADCTRRVRLGPQWRRQILGCATRLQRAAILSVLAMAAIVNAAGAATFQSDIDALVALRDSQSSAAAASLGWSGDPCSDAWAGVECDRGGRVVKLTMMVFLDQEIMYGRIPPQLGNLSALTDLNLSSCYLSGPIPPQLANLANLRTMILSSNFLSGPLPPQFGSLRNLQTLSLDFNSLNGSLPAELSELTSLETLDVEGNSFSGPIPSWLEKLGSLKDLTLAENKLRGPIPPQLGNLGSLESLDLSRNRIGGSIPPELGHLGSLGDLHLTHCNLIGPIPPQLGNLSKLFQLYLDENSLSGPIPDELANLTSVAVLDLSSNNFSGSIPLFLGRLDGLRTLSLHSNNLTGPIPPELGNLKQLNGLDLAENSLVGPTPLQFGNLHNLMYLRVSSNNLTGPIPPAVFNITSLSLLHMAANNLSGQIPQSMARFTDLDLSSNNLTGPIPQILFSDEPWMMTRLDLSSNRLSGPIPGDITGWPGRTNLVNNFLRGPLPAAAQNFTTGLNCFNISNSDFYVFGQRDSQACARYYPELSCSCPPPLVIGSNGSCYCVAPLSFDAVFTCNSTDSLGNFSTNLERTMHELATAFSVDAGQIALLTFSTVSSITLSFYILPPGNASAFSPNETASLVRFVGNPGFRSTVNVPFFDPGIAYLARRDLSYSPPPPAQPDPTAGPSPSTRPGSGWKTPVIMGALAGAVFIVVSASCIARCPRGSIEKKPVSANPARTIKETTVRKWSLADLQSATGNFDPANMLGEGGHSIIYRAALGGTVMAVKRLVVRTVQYGEEEFVREVMTIGHVHNRNLLALQGYCMEDGEYLLVYDFMPNGSLEDVLFKRPGEDRLPWSICANILVDIARAIAYLHNGCNKKIIHRDIKPGNILLDAKYGAHVADFGLVRCTLISDTHLSTLVAGTPGYVAPEYASTGHLTEKSDVYSFGVVMLVVIAHRRPFDVSAHCTLVTSAFEAAESKRLLDLVAPHFRDAFDEEEARRFISVALLCIQPAWQIRPSMEEVVQMLCGKADIPAVDIRMAISLPGFSSTCNPELSYETPLSPASSASNYPHNTNGQESDTGSI